jgi:hypothetical protein
MRRTVLGAVFALSVSAVLCFGCGSGAPPSANSFTEVYTRTIQPKCSTDFCHYYGVSMRYSACDLSSKVRAYWSLVNLPTMAPQCREQGMRVVPWHPETSIMYLNLQETPLCGIRMPADTAFRTNGIAELSSGPALPAEEQQRIFNWIREGAQDN